MELLLGDFLIHSPWPDNIRELQNVVRYLCNVVEENEIATCNHLPPYLFKKNLAGRRSMAESDAPDTSRDENVLSEFKGQNLLPEAVAILNELKKASVVGRNIGRRALVHRLQSANIILSEHEVRHWLKTLDGAGYIKAGVTRQGSTITSLGEHFLKLAEQES